MDEELQINKVLKAAKNDEWEEVTRLCTQEIGIDVKEETFPFDKGYHPDGPDYLYNKCRIYKTALEMAAISGHLASFMFLAENNLFYTDGIRKTYGEIIDACKKKDFNQIQKLLSSNVDKYNLEGMYGKNLLSLFVLHDCPPSCLQLLIDKGVDVDQWDNNALTPLMCAVLTENVNLVHFLLGVGSNVDTGTVEGLYRFKGSDKIYADDEANYMGISSLMYAACFKNNESLRVMLQYCFDNKVDFDINMGANFAPWVPIDYAVFFGNKDSVELLIKFGAELDEYHTDERNNLGVYHTCMIHHRPDILKLTLEIAEDPFYSLFAHPKICVSDTECLEVLVTYINGKCEEPQKDVYLIKLFEAALVGGQRDSLNFLLQQEFDINVTDGITETVLMRLSSNDKYEGLLDKLFELGADVHFENHLGNSAMMYAVSNNAVKCVHKLISHEASVHRASRYPIWKWETVLMVACKEGHQEIAEILLKQGSHVNAQDATGKTAAMHAADKSQDKCLGLLLAAGADLDLSDKEGRTVFCFAMLGNGGCLDMLLHSGKLLSHGVLKSKHRHALRSMPWNLSTIIQFRNSIYESRINVKCFMLTMDFKIFEWDWCSLFSNCLRSIVFAALLSGISPSKFIYKGVETSPLHMAFKQSDFSLISYILANRYLLPGDLRLNITAKEDMSEDCLKILERLSVELPSLQTLSFLTVNKAMSQSCSLPGGANMIENLPLPNLMKKHLHFDTSVSQVCPLLWDQIQIEKSFQSLNFREEVLLSDHLVKCSDSCTSCDGQGLKNGLSL